MSSLTSETTNGKTRWRLQFRVDGKPKQIRLGTIRKSAAQKIRRMIDDIADSHRLQMSPDVQTQEWIQKADWILIQRIEKTGIVSMVLDLIKQRKEKEQGTAELEKRPTLFEFCEWYEEQREADCEPSTIKKIKTSLKQLRNYCRDHETIKHADELDSALAFRFQLHRKQTKAEATVSKDIKIAKTAFKYGVLAGKLSANPFDGLKAGSDVNLEGQHIIPISDFEKLIDACPNSDWRTIVALARLGGLRCPSELTDLKWTDVNWHSRTITIRATKTKRYGKVERTMPLFERLEHALRDHFELTGETSVHVVTAEHLRRSGTSLSERFHRIRKAAGVPKFDNPFRNMRLSAVNDVCRIAGITPKTIVDWFGHDLKTAMKHYNRTTKQDYDLALAADPFVDSEIAGQKNVANQSAGYTGGYILPKHGGDSQRTNEKTPVIKRLPERVKAKCDPYGTSTSSKNIGRNRNFQFGGPIGGPIERKKRLQRNRNPAG